MIGNQGDSPLPAASASGQSSKRLIEQHGLKHLKNQCPGEDSGKMEEEQRLGTYLPTWMVTSLADSLPGITVLELSVEGLPFLGEGLG